MNKRRHTVTLEIIWTAIRSFTLIPLFAVHSCGPTYQDDKGQPIDSCLIVELNRFETRGFSFSDIDTVLIQKFIKGSGFSQIVDSFWLFPQNDYKDSNIRIGTTSPGDTTWYIDFNHNTSFDWRIRFSNGPEYSISKMTFGFDPCFDMFNERFCCIMQFYEIDGDSIHGVGVRIRKKLN